MRTRTRTKLFTAVPAIAVVLALGHGPIAAATPVEASGEAIAAAHRSPRVLCWTGRAGGRLKAERRPKRCGLVRRGHSARPAVRLTKLRWTRWAARRARATGEATGRRTRVALRRPVRGCGGLIFSRGVLRSRSRTRRFTLPTRCATGGGQQDEPGGEQPPGGDEQPVGGPCVGADEDALDGDDGPPSLSPALFAVAFTLNASLDGIDDDGSLPLEIEEVCGLPADLASEGSKLVQLSGVALLSATTEIWTCGDSEDEGLASACQDIPAQGGTLLQGAEGLSTLDGDADTAFVGVQLLPPGSWHQDEDGEPVPTFAASWVKITD